MEPAAIVKEIQDRQTQVSRRLAQIEQQLYKLEDQYLEATQFRGNVIRGWEGYLDFKPRSSSNSNAANKIRERKLKASDRIFSFSSISAPIPKSELDKDDETMIAIKCADDYEEALNTAAAAAAVPATTTTKETTTTKSDSTKSSSKRQKRE